MVAVLGIGLLLCSECVVVLVGDECLLFVVLLVLDRMRCLLLAMRMRMRTGRRRRGGRGGPAPIALVKDEDEASRPDEDAHDNEEDAPPFEVAHAFQVVLCDLDDVQRDGAIETDMVRDRPFLFVEIPLLFGVMLLFFGEHFVDQAHVLLVGQEWLHHQIGAQGRYPFLEGFAQKLQLPLIAPYRVQVHSTMLRELPVET